MKELIRKLFKSVYKEDLVQVIKESCPVPAKTNREKLHDLALTFYKTDPTPNDIQPDGYACVESLTTILSKLVPFPILTYTPKLLSYLQSDKRFKAVNEFREGCIVVFPTESGNGSIVGHCFIVGKSGKMLSNSSSTGLWDDKYDINTMIERYSRVGQLRMYIFELV